MASCGPARKTPLIQYAESLEQVDVDREGRTSSFPMYMLPVETFLQMAKVRMHEELRADGSIVEFDDRMGQAAFVSHQWLGRHHPDPDFRQLRVLQSLLQTWITQPAYVSPDIVTRGILPFAKGISSKEFFSKPLYLWYDFFCCPQQPDAGEELAKAVDSIPAYVLRARFFFVLFPVLHSSKEHKVFSPSSWAARGWCRLERTMRALSSNPSYVIIKSELCAEVVGCHLTAFGGGPPGEGMFTILADRAKLGPILRRTIKHSLMLSLRKLDLVRYRTLLNSQNFFLRGLPVEPVLDIVPGFEPLVCADEASNLVAKYLYHNGFTKVRSVDAAGCSPLCYAAMNGDPVLIDALLAQRADPNDFVRKISSKGGFPMWMSVVSICASFGNNDAMQRLLAARANVSGVFPALVMAAFSDNAKGVHILCQHSSPNIRNVFGASALEGACAAGSVAAARELLLHATPDMLNRALHAAAFATGGSAELVEVLLQARADINETYVAPTRLARAFYFSLSVRYQLGRRTLTSTHAYHCAGSTPLMLAVITGQYETSSALIAAGARLDVRNARSWTVQELAKELPLPGFLREALEGRKEECREVAALAMMSNDLQL